MFRFLGYIFSTMVMLFVVGAVIAGGAVWWYSRELPTEFADLEDYTPPETSVVMDDDGNVVARFAKEQRAVIEIANVPDLVKNAFISAEDKNFYDHRGIDPVGIAKAMVRNVDTLRRGGRMSGASTITQQVVKNMILTNERSITRKIKEGILAYRLEDALTKDQILEIYLNQIYLGARSYGVAAASQNYFGKELIYLEPEEAAYLAALPKAPSALHPTRNTETAVARRNYVLNEMVDNGHLTEAAAEEAKNKPLVTRQTKKERIEDTYDWAAGYMVEEVRGQMLAALTAEGELNGMDKPGEYADRRLYGGGMQIRTTLDTEMQEYAADALREGLSRYERRNGYRGPLDNVTPDEKWQERVAALGLPRDIGNWMIGVVLEMDKEEATIGIAGEDDRKVTIKLENVEWARRRAPNGLGPKITKVAQVFARGDVIYLTAIDPDDDAPEDAEVEYGLRQLPVANGAVVAMEPDTGRVLAMQGGFSAQQSEFNRVTQAFRQPGSAFKPFIYATAFENGYTPATVVLDAPITVFQGENQELWRPKNYREGEFFGPIPMRIGLEKSINLITIRLAQSIGMDRVAETARKFGVYDDMPPYLSYSLGAGETTLARMAAAYSMFVNGGKKVVPSFVESIKDRDGNPLKLEADWIVENAPNEREQVMDPISAYQTVSLMEGVVLRGTATRLQLLGFPVGGKTGTTNDARDAWFVGFTPNLVFGCYVGYDNPKSLGEKASGGALCGPIFDRFMRNAMADRIPERFEAPEGVELVKIDRNTGERVSAEVFGRDVIYEAFRAGTAPIDYATESIVYNEAGQPVYVDTGAYNGQQAQQPFVPFNPQGQPLQQPFQQPGQPLGQPFPQPGEQPFAQQGQPLQPGQQQPFQQQTQPLQPGFQQPFQPRQAQQGLDPVAPSILINPNTGQTILAQDPAVRLQQPAVGFVPQPGQPVVSGPQQPPGVVGNSSLDLQGGRGLY